jgi:hypothetical protein
MAFTMITSILAATEEIHRSRILLLHAPCNWLKGAVKGPQLEMLMQWLRLMKGVSIVVPYAPEFEKHVLRSSCEGRECDT